MAYIVRTTTQEISGNNNTYTVPPHKENDIVLMFTMGLFSTITVADSNFTLEAHDTQGVNCYCYSHVGLASQIQEATFEWSANQNTQAVFVVIRGAPTTDFIAGFSLKGSTGNNVTTIAPSVNTGTNDNCIVISAISDRYALFMPAPGDVYLGGKHNTASGGIMVSSRFLESAGDSGTFTFYRGSTNSSNNGGITIAIKDDGTNYRDSYFGAEPFKLLCPLISNTAGSFAGSPTTTNLTSASGTNVIPSIAGYPTYSNYDGIQFSTAGNVFNEWSNNTSVRANASSSGNSSLVAIKLDTPIDISNEIVHLNVRTTNSIVPFDKGGIVIGFSDETNSLVYSVSGNNSSPKSFLQGYPFLVQLPDGATKTGFELEEYGTFDPTSINHILIGGNVNNSQYIYFTSLYAIRVAEILGGSINNPINFKNVLFMLQSGYMNSMQSQAGQSESQFYCTQSLRIGNGGTNSVYFDATGQSIEFPKGFNLEQVNVQTQIKEGVLSFEIDSGSEKVILNSTTVNMGDFHRFILTSGDISSNGLLVLNALPQLNDVGKTLKGITFSGCKEIEYTNLADISGGCSINESVSTHAITITGATQTELQSLLDKLSNCNFNSNDTSIKIEYTGTGDISLSMNNIRFSDNTTDVLYSSTNASSLDLALSNGANPVTTSVEGNAVAVNFIVGVNLTLIGLKPNSEVRIFETGTTTEITGVENSTDTFSTTLNTSAVDIVIFALNYLPIRLVNVNTTVDLSLPIQQVVDRVYENP